jgi:sulfoxide reductase heme-binding subunit YedZ
LQQRHRLVYLVGLLGVLHDLWLVNKDLTEPLIYGRVLLCLLPLRLPAIASGLTGLCNRMTHAANKKRG